jgi:hypothetical protein
VHVTIGVEYHGNDFLLEQSQVDLKSLP